MLYLKDDCCVLCGKKTIESGAWFAVGLDRIMLALGKKSNNYVFCEDCKDRNTAWRTIDRKIVQMYLKDHPGLIYCLDSNIFDYLKYR